MKVIIIIVATIINFNVDISCQNSIECYNILNKVDSLIFETDTTNALRLLDNVSLNCSHLISLERHFRISKLCRDNVKKQSHLIKACEKGYLLTATETDDFVKRYNNIKEITNTQFADSILKISIDNLDRLTSKNKKLRKKVIRIYQIDQSLRRIKKYKKCRSHDFDLALGFTKSDTVTDHLELMKCAKEFRELDSIILQQFVDIVVEKGHVPFSDSIKFSEFDVLICHTSHFKFNSSLDSLYRHSVSIGSISPKTFAWYKGYKEEYYNLEYSYYYTHNENMLKNEEMSHKEKEEVNKQRKLIGLPSLPNSVWNYGVW